MTSTVWVAAVRCGVSHSSPMAAQSLYKTASHHQRRAYIAGAQRSIERPKKEAITPTSAIYCRSKHRAATTRNLDAGSCLVRKSCMGRFEDPRMRLSVPPGPKRLTATYQTSNGMKGAIGAHFLVRSQRS